MCIIALADGLHDDWPLIVAANRDERHDRPTEPLERWPEGIIAGRDAAAGGTWLGVHPRGRFAALTNIRHDGITDPAAPSRGGLVATFLTAAALPNTIELRSYNPFNLIVFGGAGAALMSNRGLPACRPLAPGLHLIGNAVAAEETERAALLRSGLARDLATLTRPSDLLDLLGRPGNGAMPGGAAIFLRDPEYGTRCSTVVAVGRAGDGVIVERRFDRDARVIGEIAIDFTWPPLADARHAWS